MTQLITVRRCQARHSDRSGSREVWHSFSPDDPADPFADGFGTLESLSEERLPPGAGAPAEPPGDGEVVTFVREGALAYEDPAGHSGLITAGEFRCTRRDRGHRERNASPIDSAQVFRFRLRPVEAGYEASREQKRFSAAQRRDRLCVVASPDGRQGSLRLHQDAVMCSALLYPGRHVVYEFLPGRCAWLHVVSGEVRLFDIVLAAGDGAGISAERTVSLTALQASSILLVDVGEGPGLPTYRDTDPPLSGAVLFGILWKSLADVLGTAATATIVGRAARRSLPSSPELADLVITRVDGKYGYVLPRSFDAAARGLVPLSRLYDEIQAPLARLTGQVVRRHLDRVPELREREWELT